MNLRYFSVLLILLNVLILFAPHQAAADSPTSTPTATSTAVGIDLTHLPLGDNRLSQSPQAGWIWPCHIDPNGPGAFKNGSWIDTVNGTYDLTAKPAVQGAVMWSAHRLDITLSDTIRTIVTNDLPNHGTGIFPISSSDPAYQYDRNPGKIATQNFKIELPANPTPAAQPSCAPGAVGVLLSGSVLFNALDAPGHDAVAHEVQDACGGHPQNTGTYHYHNLSSCIPDTTTSDGHSTLVGYSLDGFGIFGPHGEGGKVLTSADLDVCHGHTHEIEWDGKKVVMYHYHATADFPYTIGCMVGAYKISDMMTISGGPGGGGPGNGAPLR